MADPRILRVPVQARAQRTRAALIAAAEREFSERGYAATTARSVAARAGVATGSFYQYFADKDAMLRELARARTGELTARIERLSGATQASGSPLQIQRVCAIVAEVLDYHRRDRGLHAVISERRHADPELHAIAGESERRFVLGIAAWLRAWGFEGDAEATGFVLFALIEGAVHSHVLGEPLLSDRRLIDSVSQAALTLVSVGERGVTSAAS